MAKKKNSTKPSISRMNRQITIGFVLVTIVLAVIIAYFSLSRATIYITPETYAIQTQAELEILPEVTSTLTSSNILPGTISQLEKSVTATFTPTVTTEKSDRASGIVTIINDYSRSQVLVATTRLLSPDNKLFRTTETVTVPAGGSLDVSVLADQPGDEYEIGPTQFTIPGLWEGLQDKIYGKNESPLQRQETTSNGVTPRDLEEAKNSLLKRAESEVIQTESKADEYVITDSQLVSTKSSAQAGDVTDDFTFTVTAKITIISFNKAAVEDVAVNNLKLAVADGQEFLSYDPGSITYELKTYDLKPPTATITVDISGLTIADVSGTINKKELVGLVKEDVERYFRQKKGIKQLDVYFSPAWVKSVPPLEDHINIKIVK